MTVDQYASARDAIALNECLATGDHQGAAAILDNTDLHAVAAHLSAFLCRVAADHDVSLDRLTTWLRAVVDYHEAHGGGSMTDADFS